MRKEFLIASLVSVLILTAYITSHDGKTAAFEEWKVKFGISWAPQEEAYRRLIFQKNLIIIEKHNADSTQTYKMGVNQFTAYTNEEFANRFLTKLPVTNSQPVNDKMQMIGDVDWSTQGKVSGVKNQGSCGSCWAFSTTGVIESFYRFKSQNISLSEQQLVDCSKSQGNHGCSGGSREAALNYVKAYGITAESAYPYAAKDQTCKTQGGAYKISGHTSYSGCSGLSTGVLSHPLAVAVDAGGWSTYHSGVFSNCKTSINHAVLLVGVIGGNWKIKNSWGTSWGESGYIRLAGGNTCGVCAQGGIYPS